VKTWSWIVGLSLSLGAEFATANPPAAPGPAAVDGPVAKNALALVDKGLLGPMRARDKRYSSFSRSPPPPQQRTTRIPDGVVHHDGTGASFVTFAVDHRYRGERWERDALVGCVYLDDGRVFVRVDEAAYPAAIFAGGDGEADGQACRPTPPADATTTATTTPATPTPTTTATTTTTTTSAPTPATTPAPTTTPATRG
jgi:hypothetical protein